jgi:hypothetical protein
MVGQNTNASRQLLMTVIGIIAGLLEKWTVGLYSSRKSVSRFPWRMVRVGYSQVVRFEKEEPKTRLFLPKVGLLSIFAEVHAPVMRYGLVARRPHILRSRTKWSRRVWPRGSQAPCLGSGPFEPLRAGYRRKRRAIPHSVPDSAIAPFDFAQG